MSTDFAYETNFHSNKNFNLIRVFQKKGFEPIIYFLYISSINKCKERVAKRVSKGGHFVSDKEIENRYTLGLKHLKKAVSLNFAIFIYDMTDDKQPLPALLLKNSTIIQNNNCPEVLMQSLDL